MTVSLLKRHTRTSLIPFLQQQNLQSHALAAITIDCMEMGSVNNSTRFLYNLPYGDATGSAASTLLSHKKQKNCYSELSIAPTSHTSVS